MSAYVVHEDTIRYLVAAAQAWQAYLFAPSGYDWSGDQTGAAVQAFGLPVDASTAIRLYPDQHAEAIGATLYAANVDSVNYRYRGDDPTCIGESWMPGLVELDRVEPITVLKSIASLKYQSCERPGYDQTFAADILRRIESEAIRRLPGYDAAPWGWTRADARPARMRLVAR
jgi:hypothetical protein